MSALPAPDPAQFPPAFSSCGDVHTLPAGTTFGRIYDAGGIHPSRWHEFRHFGPTSSRFDHHPEPPGLYPDYGVTYVVPQIAVPPASHVQQVLLVCLAECFSDRGVIERGGGTTDGTQPHFVLFSSTRDVTLVDLADGGWVDTVGCTKAINTGNRAEARPWARAIHASYPTVDGVFYAPQTLAARSELPPARAVALWERAENALPTNPTVNLALSSPGLTATLETFAKRLNLGLA